MEDRSSFAFEDALQPAAAWPRRRRLGPHMPPRERVGFLLRTAAHYQGSPTRTAVRDVRIVRALLRAEECWPA